MKRYDEHGNSYKGKHLIGGWLAAQRFSPLSSLQEVWWWTDKHGAGEGLRVPHLYLQAIGRTNEPLGLD